MPEANEEKAVEVAVETVVEKKEVVVVKPGYKTTEFWMSTVAVICGLLMASGAIGEATLASQIIGGVLATLGTLGYNVGRASEKKAAEK